MAAKRWYSIAEHYWYIVGRKMTAGLLAVAAPLSLAAALLPHEHGPKVVAPVGLALAWLGYALWAEQREHAADPVPGRGSSQLRPTEAA